MSPEKNVRLWKREEKRLEMPVDDLFPEVEKTREAFENARKEKILTKQDDGTVFSSVYNFNQYGPTSRERHFQTEVHTKPGVDGLLFTVYEYQNRAHNGVKETRYYQAGSNGAVIDLDEMEKISPENEQYIIVKEALQTAARRLNIDTQYAADDRYERRRTLKRRTVGAVATMAGLALVGGGVTAGVKAWIIDPNEAAEAKRALYDEFDHSLPGDGVEMDYNSFEIISNEEFNTIPTYGGSDTDLQSPRIFEINSTDSCAVLPVKFKEGQVIRIALPKSSQYTGFHYETGIDEDEISICLVEEFGEESRESLKVAVQVN